MRPKNITNKCSAGLCAGKITNILGEKMGVNWTKEQLLAINEKDKNILVAAAARKRENSCIS